MSKMSPVAMLQHMEREFAKERAAYREVLSKQSMQMFKLRQEVTGGLQVIGWLASQCPNNTVFIKSSDLITTTGSIERKFDAEHDVYAFTYIPPSPEELAAQQAEIEAEAAKLDETPKLGLLDEPTDEVPPVALGNA